jgi:hypothetical protein
VRDPYTYRPGARVAVLCADGRVRRATITADPDTYFSVPARVSVRGRTVTGHIGIDTAPSARDLRDARDSDALEYAEGYPSVRYFAANIYGANADALPSWQDRALGTARVA